MTSKEVKEAIVEIVNLNENLMEEKNRRISLDIEGHSGISKTTTVEQISNEKGWRFVKINLANIQDLGDLIGFPNEEMYCKVNNEYKWVNTKAITDDMETSSKLRTVYAPPYWVEYLSQNDNKPAILLLDDYSRAIPQVIQATMEIKSRGEYYSWKLPPNVTVISTTNPDNGHYDVSYTDNANETRSIKIQQDFDINAWVNWAEKDGIDSRCINFLIAHHNELITETKEGTTLKTNPRQWVNFFDAISNIKDYSKNIEKILMLGSNLGDYVSTFILFVEKRYDKLPEVKDLFGKNYKTIVEEFVKILNKDGSYRADIGGIISTRLTSILVTNKKPFTEKHVERIVELFNVEDFLTEDAKAAIISNLSEYSKFDKLLFEESISKIILE